MNPWYLAAIIVFSASGGVCGAFAYMAWKFWRDS